MTMLLAERLQDALEELGCTRIPEILHQHAEEASTHNISYLDFLDKLLQEELTAKHDENPYGTPSLSEDIGGV